MYCTPFQNPCFHLSEHRVLIPEVLTNISLVNNNFCTKRASHNIDTRLCGDSKANGGVLIVEDNDTSIVRDTVRHFSYMRPENVVSVQKLHFGTLCQPNFMRSKLLQEGKGSDVNMEVTVVCEFTNLNSCTAQLISFDVGTVAEDLIRQIEDFVFYNTEDILPVTTRQ